MAYIADISVKMVNNCLLFKHNVEYAWAKFIQDSKMSKSLISKFFINLNLAPMQ